MRNSLHLEAPVRTENEERAYLSTVNLGLVLFSVIAAAGGQLLLKHGMQQAMARAHASHRSLAVVAVTSPWVWFGLAVFGVAAVVWLAVLSRVPLSLAYPFNALGYLVILCASIFALHERAGLFTWLGTTLVMVGLVTVVLSKP